VVFGATKYHQQQTTINGMIDPVSFACNITYS